MKNLLVLLVLFVMSNTFGQESYLIDSTFIRYDIKQNTFTRNVIKMTDDLLYEYDYFRLATCDGINMFVSDSLSKQYKAKKPINFKNVRRISYLIMDKIAVDSSSNILYVMVESTCSVCGNSLINQINSDEDIVGALKGKYLKYVRVNYSQIEGEFLWDFTTVKIKHRFKRADIFYMYSEKDRSLKHEDEYEDEYYEEDNE